MIFEQVLSYFACAGWHFFAMAPTAALSKSLAPIALSTAMAIEGSAQRIAQVRNLPPLPPLQIASGRVGWFVCTDRYEILSRVGLTVPRRESSKGRGATCRPSCGFSRRCSGGGFSRWVRG